ncbi:2-polyprenyl-3-methyl-5-hydroxy-6-metoxy-1,4-benzoquinol methylase [Fontibacillus solani]|uniref:2-polyprenyl-3-methyl-5-hydroxy-6-metoxy-1, 4-benzoquinol methylase n=1 Tax=Fontibacillus solani TaxID=1572857 RepID=A0A7W3XUH2_9BACL|nr:methyltransferase domain-containing protein [Fontibacillus solani]MBA9088626.1 2-polyprenyl-3-methyl-5-hydroxy-6-metoxy-1,4-benzoquinol methylase [Fontibacillus solani]
MNEQSKKILDNPLACLKKHKQYFENVEGKKIANLCGSNGRKAVPLALLGAEVTVFDISEENRKYAIELATSVNTNIDYIVTDVYDIDLEKYKGYFDLLYLEGGILHYFDDIDKLISILYCILKDSGMMILSDFHPLGKCITSQGKIDYFDSEIKKGDVAYKSFFIQQEQLDFPDVSIRSYTLSEIINSVLSQGFELKRFDEHRGWNNENIPWEFTILAQK